MNTTASAQVQEKLDYITWLAVHGVNLVGSAPVEKELLEAAQHLANILHTERTKPR